MRKPTITPEQIMEAAILLTTEIGLENITTKKIAASIGISEGSVFYYFKSKKELLTRCLYYINVQIDMVLKAIPIKSLNLMKNIKKLWTGYFLFFIDHPGYAKFYRDFRYSAYFTEETLHEQAVSFPFFSKFAQNYAKLLGLNIRLFWIFVIENTLCFAVNMSENTIQRTDDNIERIFRLISYGMYGVVKKYREKDFALPTSE